MQMDIKFELKPKQRPKLAEEIAILSPLYKVMQSTVCNKFLFSGVALCTIDYQAV